MPDPGNIKTLDSQYQGSAMEPGGVDMGVLSP